MVNRDVLFERMRKVKEYMSILNGIKNDYSFE